MTPHRSPAQVPQQSSPEPAAPQASPEEEAQQVSPEQVLQRVPPRNVATSSRNLRAEETQPQLSSKSLRAQLRSLDISGERLQKLRENVLEADKAEIAEKEAELHLLRRWVAYLENEREHADRGNRENPSTVGHLQRIGSTRAYVLFPNMGQKAVYPLTAAYLAMLDLQSRSEALSCEPLWEMTILCVDSHKHLSWIMDNGSQNWTIISQVILLSSSG